MEQFLYSLRELEDRYPGLEHVVPHWAEGIPRDAFMQKLRMFADGVVPFFGQPHRGNRRG